MVKSNFQPLLSFLIYFNSINFCFNHYIDTFKIHDKQSNKLKDYCRLLCADIKPFVTLLHFDPPQALEEEYGGFLSPKIV